MRRVIIILAAAVLVALLSWPGPWLVFTDVKVGAPVVRIPLSWDEKFEICYMHSVDIKPVCEVFSLKKEHGVFLEEMYFVMFGAGMGHWEGHGQVVGDGEWTRIEEIEKPVGKFLLRVGSRGVDHKLITGRREVNLTDLAEGKILEVHMEMRPAFFSLISKLRPEHG
ncbi:MAG TPA: DUF1850 domain-containing protein [Desulfobacteraceae bacterium]|nr:DUF1850 domain-containing protein [Desulfobacteraceae bacterium]